MDPNNTEPLNKKVDDMEDLMQGGDHKVDSSNKLAINSDPQETGADIEEAKTNDTVKPRSHKMTMQEKEKRLEELGMRADMSVFECLWIVTKLAVPALTGMLLYLFV